MTEYYFPEEINSTSAELFLQQIANAVEGDTVIFSVSIGGDISHALNIARIIREKRLNTEAHYIVASAAVPCYCAGIERYAFKNASFLFHEPFVPLYVETNVNETDLKKDAETLSQYSSAVANAIADYVGIDASVINGLIHANGGKGMWLNVDELIDINIITDIIAEDELQLAVVNKLINNSKEEKPMDEKETIIEEPVSDRLADLEKQWSERLEALNCKIDELRKRLELIENELKKPKALIPPLDIEVVERKVKNEQKPLTLKEWYEKRFNNTI